MNIWDSLRINLRNQWTNASRRLALSSRQTRKKVWFEPHILAKHLFPNTIQINTSKPAEYYVCWMHYEIRKLASHWHMLSKFLNSIEFEQITRLIDFYTYRFNRLKPHVVLDRLVFRKHYGLAIQIAKHLKLPESRILEHWAFHKVTYDKSKSFKTRFSWMFV